MWHNLSLFVTSCDHISDVRIGASQTVAVPQHFCVSALLTWHVYDKFKTPANTEEGKKESAKKKRRFFSVTDLMSRGPKRSGLCENSYTWSNTAHSSARCRQGPPPLGKHHHFVPLSLAWAHHWLTPHLFLNKPIHTSVGIRRKPYENTRPIVWQRNMLDLWNELHQIGDRIGFAMHLVCNPVLEYIDVRSTPSKRPLMLVSQFQSINVLQVKNYNQRWILLV